MYNSVFERTPTQYRGARDSGETRRHRQAESGGLMYTRRWHRGDVCTSEHVHCTVPALGVRGWGACRMVLVLSTQRASTRMELVSSRVLLFSQSSSQREVLWSSRLLSSSHPEGHQNSLQPPHRGWGVALANSSQCSSRMLLVLLRRSGSAPAPPTVALSGCSRAAARESRQPCTVRSFHSNLPLTDLNQSTC